MRAGLILSLFLRTAAVQKKRATLTIAAIAWGCLSLLLLLSFGEGLGIQLWRSSRGMGHNLAVLWPGETTLPWRGLSAGRPVRPKIEDVELLQRRLPAGSRVSGEIHNWNVTIDSETTTKTAMVIGASQSYGELRNQIPQGGGRFLDVLDERQRRRVVFLGDELAGELFGEVDPVGRTIRLNRVPFTVVGVMVPKIMMGNYGGMDEDHAIIPISTYEALFGRDELSVIVVQPARADRMDATLAELRRVLGAELGFDPADERVFGVWDTVETGKELMNTVVGIQLFLGIIGGLTLIVGGIGVANIMYAVVRERTREIGVKMALGARSAWVTTPIVLEGLIYTVFGGVIGLLMAIAAIWALDSIATEDNGALTMLGRPTLSMPIAVATAAILGTIGVLAGYFPARRAARIDPAETLRYE